MKIITWTFVIAGYINLFIGVPHTINLIQTGDWGMLRTLSYEGDAQLSQNIFQYIAGNIFGYLSPIGIVICFCELIKDKKNKFLLFSLFFVWIGTDFMAAANIASRSMVASLVFKLVIIFVMFKECLSTKVKGIAIFISTIAFALLVLYMSAVSVSRFGEEKAGSSVFFYLGHSMSSFNETVMGSMHDYAYGKYSFKMILGMLGINNVIDWNALGCKADGAFYTFVGDYYIDWGPIGTILVVLLVTSFLKKFIEKKHKTPKDFIFIVFFAVFYLDGVFVVGENIAYRFLVTAFVYYIVKIAEKQGRKTTQMYINK